MSESSIVTIRLRVFADRSALQLKMHQFIVFTLLIACTSSFPAKIPSTSLNLPIDVALSKGDQVDAHIADTPNDRSMMETTFKEPNAQDFIHTKISDFLHPTPIVDGLKEQDKYGNTGDKLEPVNTLIVRGTEVATNFIGTAAGYPKQLLTTVSGKITAALNRVGGALIGL